MGYPMIERLGLEAIGLWKGSCDAVRADELERVLSEAPVVWQTKTDATKPGVHKLLSEWVEMDEWPGATHSALLLGIQPIVKDSFESLVKDFIADYAALDTNHATTATGILNRFNERARKLVNK